MKWQPIETAPKDGTRFLGYWPSPHYADDAPCEIRTWRNATAAIWENPYDSSDLDTAPTHWMPLPEPPGAE